MKFLPIVLSIFTLLTASLYAAAPEISNLSASQRAGTKLVDITYDVSADTPTVTISLEVSSDGGATFTVPATSLSGAIGEDVAVGTGKTITWDAGADWNEQSSSTMRFKVVADNGFAAPAPPEFIEVAGGSLPESSELGAQAVNAFYIAKTEVTWAQFQEVRTWADANGYDIGSVGAGTGPNRPVTNVSWYQALRWCNARSEKEGLDPVYKTRFYGMVDRSGDEILTADSTANGYRLPSEKEWEFAARGGIQTNGYKYSGSNDADAVAWHYYNTGNSIQDVATKQANELGIHDMSGNVREWCFDAMSGESRRSTRGGSCIESQGNCDVGYRGEQSVTSQNGRIGFRVVRTSVSPNLATTEDVVVNTITIGLWVSNLTASQRAGTKLVDITYDLAADTPTVTISLEVSSDGGATFTVPATSLSGAIGEGVAVGAGKTITWDARADWNQQTSNTMRFKVVADDGLTSPTSPFIEVAAGSLPESSELGAQAVNAFYMAKTEVTWGKFQEVRTWAAANGYDIGSVGVGTGPNRPVTHVSWYQALKWCNARSEKDGLDPVYKIDGAVYRTGASHAHADAAATGYRLPREKEWEFAARGGGQTNGYEYSGSNDIDAVAWYNGNSGGSTHDVATKQANELGIYDMSGNVLEWCFDKYPPYDEVYRGGHWSSGNSSCWVTNRGGDDHYHESGWVGFRVARSLVSRNIAITDDAVVDTVSVGPPVLNLVSFYESNSGQSVTVDATPSDGYPTDFSYQWYFNGFAIPPNFGGTASSYQISGVSSNNGTWRVVVTNSTGSTEASFVYRVFIDSDGDGLHDDDEVNIHGTNPNLSDTDADGLSDADEINTHQTNPNVADSDSDGLSDGDEINTHESNPLVADSSGDGLADGFVVNAGFDPNTDYSALLTANALNSLGYYNNSQIVDARAGSVGIVRDGNSATLQLQIQRSEDLETWSSHQDDLISVPMNMPGNKQFFRFAIPQE